MSIRPIDFNGMIQRTTDVGTIKHQEDAKPLVDQQNIQAQVTRKEDAAAHQVQNSAESAKTGNDADAKEEGKGQYTPSGRKKTSDKKKSDGKVTLKGTTGSFDIKI